MANTNPQAIKAVNERFRTFADSGAQFRNRTRIVLEKIEADGVESLFTDDKDQIDDGSQTDGRSRLTNEDIKRLLDAMRQCDQFFTDHSDVFNIILRASTNPDKL